MNFKYKSYLQSFFSFMPGGIYLNYLCQKILKNLPQSYEGFFEIRNETIRHFNKYLQYKQCNSDNEIYLEFGAGWDLINVMIMSTLGFDKLMCVDIRKLVKPELLNVTLSYLERLFPEFKKYERFNNENWKKILKKFFRIKYIAPLDMRQTNFSDESINFVCTNVTLEHIPPESLLSIIKECYRILKKGGVMSHRIDYKDHWSYFDKNITEYNFLKYSDKNWKKYNPSIHYQNRLRHSDYINIFLKCGFKIVEEEKEIATPKDYKFFKTFKIANKFKHYDILDLAIKSSGVILIKE